MIRKLALLISLLGLTSLASAQVAISASHVADSFEHPIVSAKLCFTPVNAAAAPSGFRVGSVQVVPNAVCGLISDGVLQSGLSLAPNPAGYYYHVWVANRTTNAVLQDYGMTPITGTSWSLDSYDKTTATLPVSAVTLGTVTTLPAGQSATASLTNGGNGSYLLDMGIPQGPSGFGADPNCETDSFGNLTCKSIANSGAYTQSGTATNTLTGPLNGTSATFSGSVAAGGTVLVNHVSIGALGTPTLWKFDTTSPATALSSLNGFSLSAGGTLTTNGTYTGSAYNSNAQFLYDGATGAAAMTETQGHAAGFSALTAGSNIPSSSTTYQAQGLFGFLNNSSPNTNGVGVYGVCYGQANNGKCWGMNPLAVGAAGYTNQVIYGIEDDVNIEDATDTGFGLNIIGAWTAQPTGTLPAIDLGKPLGGTGTGYHWNNGIQFESGCCGTNALYIEPIPNTGGSIESQHVAFVNTNHPNPLSIYENAGDGFQIDFNDGSSIVFPEIHTTRIANIALSNHPQMFINTVLSQNTNIATGSCTFSAGSCAFNYGFTYSSVPYCEVTPHYDGLGVGSTPPTIWIYSKSTTAVTIASSSNTTSGSAEVTCFGN